MRDLRLVLALAEAGATARASELLHLTQPAVSRALASLESRLGVALFERVPRGLTPTVEGRALLAEAPRVLASLVDLERRLRTPPPPPARVRVVCECHTVFHWLPSAVVRLRAALPGIEVALAVEHTHRAAQALRDGLVDVALLTNETVDAPDLETRPLFSDEVVFVVGADHPLSRSKSLTRAQLLAHPLLTTQASRSEASWFTQKVFGRASTKARYEVVPLTEAVVDMARAGLGVAILSEWVASPYLARGDLVVRRLARGALRRGWSLAWRSDVREAATRLHAVLTATVPRRCLPPT